MRVPIPNDWDGKEWFCIQLEWPQSDNWLGLLQGILTLMTRGRYWDERTGSITDAQSVAWDIFNRNYPFISCDGEAIKPAPCAAFAGAVVQSLEELAMGLCGYNPKAFRIQDGVLQIRDFCGEWVSIGDLASTAEEPPAQIYDDIDPPPTFYSCGKVNNLIDEFILLSDAVWANYDNPLTMETNVRNSVSGAVNLERARIYQWIPQIILLDAIFDQTNFNNPTAVQRAKCIAVGSVLANGEATDAEVETVVTSLASAFTELEGPLTQWHWYAYWDFVRETFGKKDCRLLMDLGATDDTADCTCPEITDYEGSVHFTGEFTADVPGEFSAIARNNGKILDMTWNAPSGAFVSEDNLFQTIVCDEPIDNVTFRVTPLSGSNMPTDQWQPIGNCPVTSPALWVLIRTNSPSQTAVQTIISGGYEMKISTPAPASPSRTEQKPRKCGEATSTPATTLMWRIEIVEINDVPI